jgi:hypothetical protein
VDVIELCIINAWPQQEGSERIVSGCEEDDGRELGEGEEACELVLDDR